MILTDLLKKSARQFGNRIAITSENQNLTFDQLMGQVNTLASQLACLKLPDKTPVGLYLENSITYLASYWAVLEAGLVVVPLDNSLSPESLRFILSDCSVEVLICSIRFRRNLTALLKHPTPVKYLFGESEMLSGNDDVKSIAISLSEARGTAAPETDEDSLAAIFYTSGSTGQSKGVMLSHRNLVSNTIATVEYLELTESDSIMVVLPFYYIYGNSLLLTHIASGGRLVVDNRFMYPEMILDTMASEQVTGFSGVASNFTIMLGKSSLAKRDFPALKYFTQAGGGMAPETTRQLMAACPDKKIYIMYGQTEASPRVTWLPPDKLKEKLGSIGIPITGVEVDIVDGSGQPVTANQTGEIIVRGPGVMMGYWNQPEEQTLVLRDRTLFTGDLAYKDNDGYFWIVGRSKEIIKTGGNRVSAREIEHCLLESEDVLEAAVVGMPDELLGEAIKAVIVLKPGSHADEKTMKEQCQRMLPLHKLPKHFVFMESLPKLQTGKVDKLRLK